MNPAAGHGQQGQQAGQSGQGRPPPMYQASQIRSLPLLSDDEKSKYEAGLNGLWQRMHNSPANSPEQRAAQQKIMDFSRMLISKIQGRRAQAQQQQQQQQGQAQGQGQGQQRPGQGQGQAQQQAQAPQQQQQQQGQQNNAGTTGGESNTAANSAAAGAGQPGPSAAAGAAAATATKPKLPDHLVAHVNKMAFVPPPQIAEKSPADAAKWVEEMKERYGRALLTMESAKAKVSAMEKLMADRKQQGNPFTETEQQQYRATKEQQMKSYTQAQKWIENIRNKHQEMRQGASNQNAQNAQGVAAAGQTQNSQAANQTQQQNTQNVAASVNAAVEAAKNQQQMAGNRPSPSNGTPTPQQQQQQARMAQTAAQQNQAANQGQIPKQEPTQPAPVNTTMAAAQNQPPAQGVPRVQTPQSATPATAGGQTRALSHSAAMSLANQRAAATPPNGGMAAPQQGAGTPTPGGAGNTGVNAAQPPAGHTHAHPPQQPAPLQSKMPIPKQLPERSTSVPQGVTVGGGVASGRPTMSQGSGTLGGVLNQPAMPKIPAYSHDAEGDHVLSKKKLDELVRQVCGAPPESQDANMLTPEVEESVLNMADSFIDNVLHAACRNSKERGSKVLEIRDIQLVLERTYNIRIPGYSSDELRTVRKVQPSAGWIAKMSAVQAAKVMPGKGE